MSKYTSQNTYPAALFSSISCEAHMAYDLYKPDRQSCPLIFSSPHSGTVYPPAFIAQSILDAHQIRSSEDAFVNALFADAPLHGAPLLCARPPRAYIDFNRAEGELDAALIEGLPRQHRPHPRIAAGLGIIPRVVSGGQAIYSGKIPYSEAQDRIHTYWQPYHQRLSQLIAQTHNTFGFAILIDCHSMPHAALPHRASPQIKKPAQIILGDCFGNSAPPQITQHIEDALMDVGLSSARNAPFAGGYITQHYGQPDAGFHAVQIEIDRALYMDEARIEIAPSFPEVQAKIAAFIAQIAAIDPKLWHKKASG